MKVAVCGVTGLVGSVMCKVLEERNFPVDEFIPVASDRSIGKEVVFKGKSYKVVGMSDAVAMRPDLALFSAGGDIAGMGAKVCSCWHHSYRQFFGLANG